MAQSCKCLLKERNWTMNKPLELQLLIEFNLVYNLLNHSCACYYCHFTQNCPFVASIKMCLVKEEIQKVTQIFGDFTTGLPSRLSKHFSHYNCDWPMSLMAVLKDWKDWIPSLVANLSFHQLNCIWPGVKFAYCLRFSACHTNSVTPIFRSVKLAYTSTSYDNPNIKSIRSSRYIDDRKSEWRNLQLAFENELRSFSFTQKTRCGFCGFGPFYESWWCMICHLKVLGLASQTHLFDRRSSITRKKSFPFCMHQNVFISPLQLKASSLPRCHAEHFTCAKVVEHRLIRMLRGFGTIFDAKLGFLPNICHAKVPL